MIKVTTPAKKSVVVSPVDTTATVRVKPTPTAVSNVSSGNKIGVVVTAVGPAGPPGISEEEMIYSKRTDFVGDDVIYRGEAAVGSSDDSPAWRIRRITIGIDGDVTELWAEGTAQFANVWSDRTNYTYE